MPKPIRTECHLAIPQIDTRLSYGGQRGAVDKMCMQPSLWWNVDINRCTAKRLKALFFTLTERLSFSFPL